MCCMASLSLVLHWNSTTFLKTTVYSSPSMCLLHFVEGIQTQFAAHINSKSTNIFLGDTNCIILNTFPTQ